MVEIKKEASEKIKAYKLDKDKLVEFIRKKASSEQNEFSFKYADEKTWKNYLLIGSKDEEGVIFLNDIGVLLHRVSKDAKIYTTDAKSDGISVRDHFKKSLKKD